MVSLQILNYKNIGKCLKGISLCFYIHNLNRFAEQLRAKAQLLLITQSIRLNQMQRKLSAPRNLTRLPMTDSLREWDP